MATGLMRKWIEALESGEYKQEVEGLKFSGPDDRSPDGTWHGYCCLGVLCEISGLGEFVSVPLGANRATYSYRTSVGISSDFPPEDVEEAAGIDRTDSRYFARLNDGQGLTFTEIAEKLRGMYNVPKEEVNGE